MKRKYSQFNYETSGIREIECSTHCTSIEMFSKIFSDDRDNINLGKNRNIQSGSVYVSEITTAKDMKSTRMWILRSDRREFFTRIQIQLTTH